MFTILAAAALGVVVGALYNAEVDKVIDEYIGKWPRRTVGLAALGGIVALVILN